MTSNIYFLKNLLYVILLNWRVFYAHQFQNLLRKMKMVSWMWKWGSKNADDVKEDDLKKGGFDPTAQVNQQQQSKKDIPIPWDHDYDGYILPQTKQQALEIISKLKIFPAQGEPRHELSHSKGGKICGSKDYVNKIRSVGKQMLKIVGKKVLSGDFNLTRITFPIKTMVPKTALQNCTFACSTLPYYMRVAVKIKDPVQRMKLVLTAVISSGCYMNLFLKPLNPVIGQTLQARYPDGTLLYCEQISHHPPISYFLVIGPDNSYKYSGYYHFQATAGLNSVTLINKGQNCMQFADGMKITGNYCKTVYCGTFIGALRVESISGFKLVDEDNKVQCQVNYGKEKKKPSDVFTGSIIKDGKSVCKYQGSYMGYMDFQGRRYWDFKQLQPFKIQLEENFLDSDFRNRKDLQLLKENKIQEAQNAKDEIQDFQRRDTKLRNQYMEQMKANK